MPLDCLCGSINPDKTLTIVLTSEVHCWLLSTKACFYKFSNKDEKKLNFNTDGLVTTDYLRAKTTDVKILLLNGDTSACNGSVVLPTGEDNFGYYDTVNPLHRCTSGMMPQRSGGLENSKFFIQTDKRSSTQ